jgi:hypothetical protein
MKPLLAAWRLRKRRKLVEVNDVTSRAGFAEQPRRGTWLLTTTTFF